MVQKYRDPNGIGNSEKFATATKKPLTGRGGEDIMAGTREEVSQMAVTLYSVCTGKRFAVVLDAMRLVEIQLRCKARIPDGDTYGAMVKDIGTGELMLADED